MNINELDIVLSASRDPNDTTEKMVIVWEKFVFDWTNGELNMQSGQFSLFFHSKVIVFS